MVSLDIFDALTQSCGANGLTFYSPNLTRILEVLINPQRPYSELKIAASKTVNYRNRN